MTVLDYYMTRVASRWEMASRTSFFIMLFFLLLFIYSLWKISKKEKTNKRHYSFSELLHVDFGKTAFCSITIVLCSLFIFMPNVAKGRKTAFAERDYMMRVEKVYHITHLKSNHLPSKVVQVGTEIKYPHWYDYL